MVWPADGDVTPVDATNYTGHGSFLIEVMRYAWILLHVWPRYVSVCSGSKEAAN